MTHEELLAKIEKRYQIKYASETDWQATTNGLLCFMNALHAVVELHKPISCGCGRWDCEAKLCGSICGKVGIYYPCPTIQAIEKELN